MAIVPSTSALAYLRAACQPFTPCKARSNHLRSVLIATSSLTRRKQHDFHKPSSEPSTPLRKQIKQELKARKASKTENVCQASSRHDRQASPEWELTVGIEIHAELNTSKKLFSYASTSLSDAPNSHVAEFDAALPGAQPEFQYATLIPALRAALALKCTIMRQSSWDRKHYFWWDQPNGYQITQYYEPFAKDGALELYLHDDIEPADCPPGTSSITIGIKQIQMEQDTAKTTLQPPTTHLLDFNRVSHPLIEIITLPQIHSPRTAAAVVRKIQAILKTIDANTTGMEMGGLRADVNVSVRPKINNKVEDVQGYEYAGIKGLGQRTEIKNLSSFKAVEDAIIAEKHRQVAILEAGGAVEGETRGWSLGSTQTRRIRGKEGEIDYRYMHDPDLPSVIIGEELLKSIDLSQAMLPDDTVDLLVNDAQFQLTTKDAKTLLSLDDGQRLEYYLELTEFLDSQMSSHYSSKGGASGRLAANWILHELPPAMARHNLSFAQATKQRIGSSALGRIVACLLHQEITLPTAKALLDRIIGGEQPTTTTSERTPTTQRSLWDAESVDALIKNEGLKLEAMTDQDYLQLAQSLVDENGQMAAKVLKEETRATDAASVEVGAQVKQKKSGGKGKIMWFVGQMVKKGEEGRIQPERAENAVRHVLGIQ